jgi:hypothetical protein
MWVYELKIREGGKLGNALRIGVRLAKYYLIRYPKSTADRLSLRTFNIIDQPFESTCKFIHVLSGVFLGYKMEAFRPKKKKDILLKE